MDTHEEIWLPYLGKQFSNFGRVKTSRHKDGDYHGSLNRYTGYRGINIRDGEVFTTLSVHRAVALLFLPNPDPVKSTIVNHIAGNKENNHFANLEWTTTADNTGKKSNQGVWIDMVDPSTNRVIKTWHAARLELIAAGFSYEGIKNCPYRNKQKATQKASRDRKKAAKGPTL